MKRKLKMNKKCKVCGAKLSNMCRKMLCHTCYQHEYTVNRWKNNAEYRKKQKERTNKWIKDNPERWREICKKASIKYWAKKKNDK